MIWIVLFCLFAICLGRLFVITDFNGGAEIPIQLDESQTEGADETFIVTLTKAKHSGSSMLQIVTTLILERFDNTVRCNERKLLFMYFAVFVAARFALYILCVEISNEFHTHRRFTIRCASREVKRPSIAVAFRLRTTAPIRAQSKCERLQNSNVCCFVAVCVFFGRVCVFSRLDAKIF